MVDDSSRQAEPLYDNYAEFGGKIDAARVKLQKRSTSLDESVGLVQELFDTRCRIHSQWKTRHASLQNMIKAYNGEPEGLKLLNEFLMTAQRMESASSHESDIVKVRLDELGDIQTEIKKAVSDLDEAKSKIELSRYESNARANLGRITSSIASSGIIPVENDIDLQVDISQARLAIASAEALVEIKGDKL